MEDYTLLEKLIEFGRIWLLSELMIAFYLYGIPLFFHILVGELKNGLKEFDWDVFFDASVVVTFFYVIIFIFSIILLEL